MENPSIPRSLQRAAVGILCIASACAATLLLPGCGGGDQDPLAKVGKQAGSTPGNSPANNPQNFQPQLRPPAQSNCKHPPNSAEITQLVNAFRAKQQTCGTNTHQPPPKPLQWNGSLANAAQAQAQAMADKHELFQSREDLEKRAIGFGYQQQGGVFVFENVSSSAGDEVSAQAIFENSVTSASSELCTHVMAAKYQDFGAGCRYDETGKRTYWSQILGSRSN